jgi:hypothetical protein
VKNLNKRQKEKHIESRIPELRKIENNLHYLKKSFYGDFKHNVLLEGVPDPNKWINKAIECLNQAIYEASIIEVNSI